MEITSLELINYRNYHKLKINFHEGINVLYGKNGQGKTNLLEAILLMSTMKSHRLNDDKKLIKYASDYATIKTTVLTNSGTLSLKAIITSKGKSLFNHHNQVKKVSDFIGQLNAVLFCPDDIRLFNETPKFRRHFIDVELGKISNNYTNLLSDYNRLMKERNNYLKTSQKIDDLLLDSFDEQLAYLDEVIIKQRYQFLKTVFNKTNLIYQKLANVEDSDIAFKYESFITLEELNHQKIIEKIRQVRLRDIKIRQTSVGIHKDDFDFLMNGVPIKEIASQGQKRTLILSIKLGIVYTIYELTNDFPIVLLDDVFSELDAERKNKLLNLLDKRMQIFITTNEHKRIKLKNGNQIHYYLVDHAKVMEVD